MGKSIVCLYFLDSWGSYCTVFITNKLYTVPDYITVKPTTKTLPVNMC